MKPGQGPLGHRRLERNAIALLGNYSATEPLDRASAAWLGLHSDRQKVVGSGLWNDRHVDDPYDPAFLGDVERLVEGI